MHIKKFFGELLRGRPNFGPEKCLMYFLCNDYDRIIRYNLYTEKIFNNLTGNLNLLKFRKIRNKFRLLGWYI